MLLLQQSGWQDSNLRPPGPKPGALAKLSHTPLFFFIYLCFVVRRKTYYMLSNPKCQHLFSFFFDFFWKSDFLSLKKFLKPAKHKALRAFHFFEKSFIFLLKKWFVGMVFKIFCKKIFFSHNKKISIFYFRCLHKWANSKYIVFTVMGTLFQRYFISIWGYFPSSISITA